MRLAALAMLATLGCASATIDLRAGTVTARVIGDAQVLVNHPAHKFDPNQPTEFDPNQPPTVAVIGGSFSGWEALVAVAMALAPLLIGL